VTRTRLAIPFEPLVLLGLATICTLWAQPPSRFALFENSLLRWLLFTIPFMIYAGRKALPTVSRVEAIGLAAIFLVAVAIRFSLRPLPYHPFNWMNDLVGRVSSEPEPAWYANGYGIFMWLFTLLGLTPEQAIFNGNRIAGALTPLAMFGAVRGLGGRPGHALWSAFLLAIVPVHARLSASESMQIIPTLFLFLSVTGFRGHARTGDGSLLFVGIGSFSYACLTRPETSVLAIALPLLYLPPDERRRAFTDWRLPAGLIVALVVGGALVRAGALPHGVALVSPWQAARAFGATTSSAGAPHLLFALLGLLGGLVLLQRDRRASLFFLVGLCLLVELAGFELNPDNRLQLLATQFPWILAAAGAFPDSVIADAWKDSGRLRVAMSVSVALLFGLVAAQGTLWQRRGPPQEEWLFLDSGLAALETSGLRQIVRPQRPDWSEAYIGSLPDYRLPPGTKTWTLTDALAGKVPSPFGYYRAWDCFQGEGGFFEGWRPLCDEVERKYGLRPLATTRLHDHEIGFFEATRLVQ
jgi:hypothetical protein